MAKRSPLAAARGALLSMVLLMVVMAAGIFGSTYSEVLGHLSSPWTFRVVLR